MRWVIYLIGLDGYTCNDIFDFTEREIRHIPGWRIRLIARHLPTRLADEFKHNLNEHNWSLCNKVLESFVQFFPLSSPLDQALLKSQVHYGLNLPEIAQV